MIRDVKVALYTEEKRQMWTTVFHGQTLMRRPATSVIHLARLHYTTTYIVGVF